MEEDLERLLSNVRTFRNNVYNQVGSDTRVRTISGNVAQRRQQTYRQSFRGTGVYFYLNAKNEVVARVQSSASTERRRELLEQFKRLQMQLREDTSVEPEMLNSISILVNSLETAIDRNEMRGTARADRVEREDALTQSWSEGLDDDYYTLLRDDVQRITRTDQSLTPDEKYSEAIAPTVPGRVTSTVVNTHETILRGVKFEYDQNGDFVVEDGISKYTRKKTEVALSNLLERDSRLAPDDPNKLSSDEIATLNRMLSALTLSINRDEPGRSSEPISTPVEPEPTPGSTVGPTATATASEPTPGTTATPTVEPTATATPVSTPTIPQTREVEVVMKSVIQEEIDRYRRILEPPVLTTMSRDDAQRYNQIMQEREADARSIRDLQDQIRAIQTTGSEAENEENLLNELNRLQSKDINLEEAQLRSRLEELQSSGRTDADTLSQISRIEDILATLEMQVINEQRARRAELRRGIEERQAQLDSDPNATRISELRSAIEANQASLTGLESTSTTLTPEQQRIIDQRTDATTRVSSLRTSIASHEATIENIQGEQTQDTQERINNQQEIANLQADIDEWQEEINRLLDQGLLSSEDELRARLAELQAVEGADAATLATIARIQEILAAIEAQRENETREARIAELRESISNDQSELDGLENSERRRTLNQEIADMTAEMDTLPEDLDLSDDAIRERLAGLPENTSDDIRRRLERLLMTYEYPIALSQREYSDEERADAQARIDELTELMGTTPEDVPYVYGTEVDRRLEEYRDERDTLMRQLAEYERTHRGGSDPENPYERMSDEEIANRIAQLNDRLIDLWNFGAHAQNGMEGNEDDELGNIQAEINRLVAEQSRRNTREPENPYAEMSDDDIRNRISELEERRYNLYMAVVHGENGVEENDDNEYQELTNEIDRLSAEMARREDEREPENPYATMSDEEIANRINELKQRFYDEYMLRAHQENGMEEHEDNTLANIQSEIDALQAEQNRRNNERQSQNPYERMSDEDIDNRIQELEAEYAYRSHQENGMEEHDDGNDNLMAELSALRAEKERRANERGEGDSIIPDDFDPEVARKRIQELNSKIDELENLPRERIQERDGQTPAEPTQTPTVPTQTPTEPTQTPTVPTQTPTEPTQTPTVPTQTPTVPTQTPTVPTQTPTVPTQTPTEPTQTPTVPTQTPAQSPRHWVEIMADTQTQSSGSIPTWFHQMGRIQPFRAGITLPLFPVKAIMKGAGMLVGDGIFRVGAKREELVQNIRDLAESNPEEFEILVNGLTETNMRQYKVNEVYLDAVQEVLTERENARKAEAVQADRDVNDAIEYNNSEIERLRNELSNPALTDVDRANLEVQLQRHVVVGSMLQVQHAQAYQTQIDADKRVTDFDRGKVGKSTRKMNIQGWLAGSFNPDNRELHRQEADLRRQQREASDRGDAAAVLDIQTQIDELQESHTHEIQLLAGTRFESRARISRGQHKVEKVHSRSNDAEQTKGRELVAMAMTAVSLANMVRNVQQNQALQQQVDDHLNDYNQNVVAPANSQNASVQTEINNANAQNATVQSQIESARSSVSEQDVVTAGINDINKNNALTYASQHEHEFLADNTPGVGFNLNGSDDAIHAQQAVLTQSREAAESGGTISSVTQGVQDSSSTLRSAVSSVYQDVKDFTSIAGKSAFENSEYVSNLEAIMNSSTDSFTLLSNLFKATGQIGDTAQITGTISQISDIAPLVLETSGSVMVNALPFIVSVGNLVQLEQKRAQMMQQESHRQQEEELRRQQEAQRQAERQEGEAQTEEEGR